MPVFRLSLLAAVMACAPARADVRLPQPFGDHMVVQCDAPVRVYGYADAGEDVTVTLGPNKGTARTGTSGRWEVTLPAMKASAKPIELTAAGKTTVTRKDILVGEVWFCSGQSNMALPVLKSGSADQEIAAAEYPNIRLFTTPTSEKPVTDVAAEWRPCSPKTVSYFSAAAYYFGRELHRKLDVPVGLVVSAVNGTRIEPWTPAVGVKAVKALDGIDKAADGELFTGMVKPFVGFGIRGVIWYQGEGNVGDGMRYADRMRALVGGWRAEWDRGAFPFYYVQLTPLNWGGKPVDAHPRLWEAQSAARDIPNTGMVVTTDIVGNVGEAHPKNKQEVGRRLALWALAKTYGKKDLAHSGPVFTGMKIDGGKVIVSFDAATGLRSRDGKPLTWFAVAGADGKFVPATAEIDGETVVVSAPTVPKPVHVRFAWHQVAEPNLENKHGLPACPFRTDRD